MEESNNNNSNGGGSTGRLVVAVRIRPPNARESNAERVVKPSDDKTVVVTDPEPDELEEVLKRTRSRDFIYSFDNVFGEEVGQGEVYSKSTKWLIDAVVAGGNCCVFAYGATSTGKTYTMLGKISNSEIVEPGIMPRALLDLFSRIEEERRATRDEFSVSLTYLEIYNESIKDLLSGDPESPPLDLRDNGDDSVVVAGITHLAATSAAQILSALQAGSRYRTTEATGANEVSSRSHAVLQVFVTRRVRTGSAAGSEVVSKLSMIDLAGSERAQNTNNRGIRMIEGANINRSLLALANCINALVDGKGKHGGFVNFRDSKLTRLLKDSLGKNSKTVMIANVSPAAPSFDETQNTLKYASRARNIRTDLTQQVVYRNSPYAAQNLDKKRAEFEIARAYIGSAPNIKMMKKSSSEVFNRRFLASIDNASPSYSNAIRQLNNDTNAFKNRKLYQDSMAILRKLLTDYRECRTKLHDIDDASVATESAIMEKEFMILTLEEELEENKNDAKKRERREKLVIEVLEIKNKMAQNKALKLATLAEINTITDKIKQYEESIPKALNKINQQHLQLLIRAFQSENQHQELKKVHQLSKKLLRGRDKAITRLQTQLTVLDKIAGTQRNMIEATSPARQIPHELVALYEHLRAISEDEDEMYQDDEEVGEQDDNEFGPQVGQAKLDIWWKTLLETLGGQSQLPPITSKPRLIETFATAEETLLSGAQTPVTSMHSKDPSFSPPVQRRRLEKHGSFGFESLTRSETVPASVGLMSLANMSNNVNTSSVTTGTAGTTNVKATRQVGVLPEIESQSTIGTTTTATADHSRAQSVAMSVGGRPRAQSMSTTTASSGNSTKLPTLEAQSNNFNFNSVVPTGGAKSTVKSGNAVSAENSVGGGWKSTAPSTFFKAEVTMPPKVTTTNNTTSTLISVKPTINNEPMQKPSDNDVANDLPPLRISLDLLPNNVKAALSRPPSSKRNNNNKVTKKTGAQSVRPSRNHTPSKSHAVKSHAGSAENKATKERLKETAKIYGAPVANKKKKKKVGK